MAVDFAIICSLVRPGRPRYPVLVHRAATLLHASSGRRLAMTPLRFANPSPPSGWIEDFHLQAVDHARHTEKSPAEAGLVGRHHAGLPTRGNARAGLASPLHQRGAAALVSVGLPRGSVCNLLGELVAETSVRCIYRRRSSQRSMVWARSAMAAILPPGLTPKKSPRQEGG
jgi:hypothetical protein